jgi:hypothetical protein
VARLAAHAVGELETLAALRRRRVVRVAVEAEPRLVRGLLQPEVARDALRTLVQKDRVRAGVVLVDTRPGDVFVLQDVGVLPTRHRPVAQAARAVDDPEMLPLRLVRQRLRVAKPKRKGRKKKEKEEKGRKAIHGRVPPNRRAKPIKILFPFLHVSSFFFLSASAQSLTVHTDRQD